MPSTVLPIATVAMPVAGLLVGAAIAAIPAALQVAGMGSMREGDARIGRVLGWLPGLALIGAATTYARMPDDASYVIGATTLTIGPIARGTSTVACGAAALVALHGASLNRGTGTAIAAAMAAVAIVVSALAGDITRVGAAGIHVALLVAAIAMATAGAGSHGSGQGGWRAASATLTLGSLGLVIILAGLSLADVLRVSPGGLVTESFVIAVLAVGFALVIGLPPLHFWIPVAAWRPGTGSAIVALGVVVPAAVGYLVQVLAAIPQLGGAALTARLLTVGGTVACVVGAIGAVAPGRLGRRVGYAAIAGIGPVLLGLGTGTRIGVAGALVALAHHAACTIVLVATAPSVEASRDRRPLAPERAENPLPNPSPNATGEYSDNYGRVRPLHRVAFVMGAVAASGIPPLGGFASRWAIMQALSLSDWRLGMAVGVTSLVTLGALLSGATRRGGRSETPALPARDAVASDDLPGHVGHDEGARTRADVGGALLVLYALGACAWGVAPGWAIEQAWRATAQLGYLRPF